MALTCTEKQNLIYSQKTLEDGRVVIVIDEDACDALFLQLESNTWNPDWYSSDSPFTPIYKAIRMIKDDFHSQNPNFAFSDLAFDEQSIQLIGAVFNRHFTPKLVAEVERFGEEINHFLTTATPPEVDLQQTGKYHNPMYEYMNKLDIFFHDFYMSTGCVSDVNILKDYIRATLPHIFKIGLAYVSMRKNDKSNDEIMFARVFAVEQNLEYILNNKYASFILDGTDSENHPNISSIVDSIFNTSFGKPLSNQESLNVFLASMSKVLKTPYFNEMHFQCKEPVDAARRKIELIKIIKRHYFEIIKLRIPDLSAFVYRYPYLKETLELLIIEK